jgi:hypothetical protein
LDLFPGADIPTFLILLSFFSCVNAAVKWPAAYFCPNHIASIIVTERRGRVLHIQQVLGSNLSPETGYADSRSW